MNATRILFLTDFCTLLWACVLPPFLSYIITYDKCVVKGLLSYYFEKYDNFEHACSARSFRQIEMEQTFSPLHFL